MVVNLVKRHPVEDLVSKLKSGKTIAKEQVIRESMLFRLQYSLLCLLIVIFSDQQGRRRRYSGHFLHNVVKMSIVDIENRYTLPFFHLQS